MMRRILWILVAAVAVAAGTGNAQEPIRAQVFKKGDKFAPPPIGPQPAPLGPDDTPRAENLTAISSNTTQSRQTHKDRVHDWSESDKMKNEMCSELNGDVLLNHLKRFPPIVGPRSLLYRTKTSLGSRAKFRAKDKNGADFKYSEKPSFMYTGGASRLFSAGERSPRGLQPSALTATEANAVLPGHWGGGKVYEYSYNTIPNFRRRYEVDCYCMEELLCSCDRVERNELYFFDIRKIQPDKLSSYSIGRNSHYAINGSVDPAEVKVKAERDLGEGNLSAKNPISYMALAVSAAGAIVLT